MIVVRLTGGLGNQMFQYACGRALAERNGARLKFDLSAYRFYQLHEFGLRELCAEISEVPWYLESASRFWSVARRVGFSSPLRFRLLGFQYIDEAGDLRYRPERLEFRCSAYLDGYWQCARYFEDFSSRIRKDFALKDGHSKRFCERRQELGMGCGTCVSVHIRRGDYVSDQSANAVHGVLGEEYYSRAVKAFANYLNGDFRLVVFSDDISWARANLRLGVETVFVQPDVAVPQIDMHLMASCDHHIIANSSFSWWGAWLNPSLTKRVVAPANWFRSMDLCGDDICPADWWRV